MPKVEKIEDRILDHAFPLLLTRRKAREKTAKTRALGPSIRVKCGDGCGNAIVIFHDENIPDLESYFRTLEINGVHGTVNQWRKVFAPLLGFTEEFVGEGLNRRAVWHSVYPA